MADKFHINPETGNPNKCVAKPGNCRFGSDTNHYGSKDEARQAYEERMSAQAVATQNRKQREDEEHGMDDGWEPVDKNSDSYLTHEFQSEYLGEYVDRIEKANRRLEKYGISERFEYTLEEYVVTREKKGGMVLSEPYTRLKLNSPSISINGNKFLAVITEEPAGFVTRSGKDVELSGWRPDSMKCEHCGINRPRNKTYLIEDENGERHQIGSSCVDAYLGVKPEGLWAIGADPTDGVSNAPRAPNPRELERPTEHMIAYALAVSDEGQNFVSRTTAMNYEKTATADAIETALWSTHKDDREWALEMEAKANEYLANGKAKEVLEEIRKVEGDNDYATNLRTVAAGEQVNPRNSALLVSGLSVYRKKQEKAKRESAPKAAVGFAAPIKAKIAGKKAVVTRVQNIPSYDQYTGNEVTKSKINFRDENGHELIWWASRVIDEVEEGQEVTFTGGSVKAHNHYNGVDQTSLTRVKFE